MSKKPSIDRNSARIRVVDEIKVDIDQKDQKDLKVLLTNKPGKLEKVTMILAVFSLLVSGLTIWYSYTTHREDTNYWKSVNLARISIIDVSYLTFRKVSFAELLENDWGYIPQAQADPTNNFYNPNEASIKSILVAHDTISNIFLNNTSAIKVDDLKKELLNKGFTDLNRYNIEKKFQPIITIQNVGLTSCLIDSIIYRNLFVDSGNYNIKGSNTTTLLAKSFTLEPGQKYSSGRFLIYLPINAPIPDIEFEYEIYFENIDQEKKIKKFRITGGASIWNIRNLNGIN